MSKTKSAKYDFYIYFFIQNYKYLRNKHQSRLKSQIDNIKELLTEKIKEFNGEFLDQDFRSITIYLKKDENTETKSKFEPYIEACQILEECSVYINQLLTADDQFCFRSGIILSKELKNNKFRKIFSGRKDMNLELPFILLSERAAKSIFDEYNVYQSEYSDIWYTYGEKISDAERINNIDYEREESFVLEEFAVSEENYNILSLYGELGTGKTKLALQLAEKKELPVHLMYVSARKKSEREFYVVIRIIEELILTYTEQDSFDENTLEVLKQADLTEISLENLVDFTKNYFIDSEIYQPEENLVKLNFHTIISRLKFALLDMVSLVNKKLDEDICIIIDNYHYLSKSCESVLLSVYNDISIPEVKYIFITQERLNSGNYKEILKEVRLPDLSDAEIKSYLKQLFPYKSVAKTVVSTIEDITSGNFLCLKEYLIYLLEEDLLIKTERSLKLEKFDNSELPGNLLELFHWKINKLDNYSKELIRLVSVFGSGFRLNDLEMLLHNLNFQEKEREALEEMCNMGLLRNFKNYYEIIIPEIFQEAYRNIPINNRLKLHSILANMFLKRGYPKNSFKIFYHFIRANNFAFIQENFMQIVNNCRSELRFSAYKNILNFTSSHLSELEEDPQNRILKLNILNLVYELGDYDFLNSNIINPEATLLKLDLDQFREHEAETFKSYYILAESLMKGRKFKRSFNVITKLESFLSESENKVIKADLNLLKAQYFDKINKFKEFNYNLKLIEDEFPSPESVLQYPIKFLKLSAKKDYKSRNYLNASNKYLQVYERQKSNNDIGQIYYTIEQLAQLTLYNKKYQDSYKYYKQLLKFVTYFGNIEKQNDYLIKIAILEAYLDRIVIGMEILDDLIPDLELESNFGQLYQALHHKGMISRIIGFPDSSTEAFNKAIKASVKTENKSWRFYSNIYYILNFLYFNQLDKAEIALNDIKSRFKAPAYLSITDVCKKMIMIGFNQDLEESFENVISKMSNKIIKNISKDLQFELKLILIKILYDNKHFLKAQRVIQELLENPVQIYDKMKLELFNNYKTAVEAKLNRKSSTKKKIYSNVKSYYKKRAQKRRKFL